MYYSIGTHVRARNGFIVHSQDTIWCFLNVEGSSHAINGIHEVLLERGFWEHVYSNVALEQLSRVLIIILDFVQCCPVQRPECCIVGNEEGIEGLVPGTQIKDAIWNGGDPLQGFQKDVEVLTLD